ncbi:MAG: phage terminase large subunit [Oscillospiraceae bacterium]|nr:phage terminase large subunit [Oscillospiraceae bacterium]
MSAVQTIRAELARRELARRNYIDYLAYVGGEGFKRTRFAEYVARQLQDFVETDTGNAYDILILETPPQHGKSMSVTEALPSWYLGRHPNRRVILASYNDDSAERFARRNKEKVSAFGQSLFGVTIGAISRATEFELSAKKGGAPGRLISRGMLAGITGNSADLLIIDDPIKNRTEADSEIRRTQIWNEWLSSLKSRLAAGAKVVVIMTPWHEDDLAARLLAAEEHVTLVRLPVEAEENDPLGRKPGDALCPELGKDNKWLSQFKSSYLRDAQGGERAWRALYQCSPRAEEGGMVKRSWWRYYDEGETPHFAREIISVDAAFKGGEKNDFVAIEVWGKAGNDYYLRYCLNRHMDFPETVRAIRTVQRLYPQAMTVLIEDKANGSAIIQTLQKEMFCVPITPMGGKSARVSAVSPAIESGHVYLPRREEWVEAFVDQFTAFPVGKHDDMVDSATQAIQYLLHVSGEVDTKENRQEDETQALFDAYLYNYF